MILKLSSSRGGTDCSSHERSGLVTQAPCHMSLVLWRLSEFALKENSRHTQAFFFIHRLTKHILVHHFFITCVYKELGQEFCKTGRSTALSMGIITPALQWGKEEDWRTEAEFFF